MARSSVRSAIFSPKQGNQTGLFPGFEEKSPACFGDERNRTLEPIRRKRRNRFPAGGRPTLEKQISAKGGGLPANPSFGGKPEKGGPRKSGTARHR
nr:hypothetical protein [Bacillaceae bacterium]